MIVASGSVEARYYDPVIGRFYSNDPIEAHSVQSFNRYAYANNNPYAYTDPDGQLSIRKIKPTPLPIPPPPAPMNPPHVPPNTPSGQPPVTLPDVPDILQVPPTTAVVIVGLAIIQNISGPEEKETKPGQSGKEAGKDVPSWAKGSKPRVNENGNNFADRLLNGKYGKGNYPKGPRSEHNKIKKWGDRGFQAPKA